MVILRETITSKFPEVNLFELLLWVIEILTIRIVNSLKLSDKSDFGVQFLWIHSTSRKNFYESQIELVK